MIDSRSGIEPAAAAAAAATATVNVWEKERRGIKHDGILLTWHARLIESLSHRVVESRRGSNRSRSRKQETKRGQKTGKNRNHKKIRRGTARIKGEIESRERLKVKILKRCEENGNHCLDLVCLYLRCCVCVAVPVHVGAWVETDGTVPVSVSGGQRGCARARKKDMKWCWCWFRKWRSGRKEPEAR